MNLDNICKHCRARIYSQKLPNKRHYNAPPLVREAWNDRIGSFPLGPFYKVHCEVCHKYMAVFDRPRGSLEGGNIVLYLCTFSDIPASDKCEEYGNCYNCPIPKEQKKQGVRKYY